MSYFKIKYIPVSGDSHGNAYYAIVRSMVAGREIIDVIDWRGHKALVVNEVHGFWEDFTCRSYEFSREHLDDVLVFLKSLDGIYYSSYMFNAIDVYFENEDYINTVDVYFSLMWGS